MYVDISSINKEDQVSFITHEGGTYFIQKGTVNFIYEEGVDLKWEDETGSWSQYVSKFFINKVERKGEVVYEQSMS